MRGDFAYARPDSLDEAVAFLKAEGDSTVVLAGGTDVLVDLRSGDIRPAFVLDVSRLPELKGIASTNGEIRIGAGVTIQEIQAAGILRRFAPALQKATYGFASRQIRNVATIGGNVAHCSPCGDTVPPLLIHEARVVLKSAAGERTLPIEAISAGPYKSALPPDEMIVCFLLKPRAGVFADFQKIGRRKQLAIARASMAVMAEQDEKDRVSFVRVALGACTPTPSRLEAVEQFLEGKALNESVLWQAGRMVVEKMIDITGFRPSYVYKEKAVQGLFMRMLSPMVNHAT